ncbi:lecithin retinol acyltransferase family protein [Bibersteinia trehalosi]|uniref:lecithin retinol acyltransferase family protein n=1 Tax=Bibersteinia trehalosi TaxID=47735 RepID=UPI00404638C1
MKLGEGSVADLTRFKRGDHLKSRRYGIAYAHHGIYLGEGKVIHYSGSAEDFDLKTAKVEITTLYAFADGKIDDIIVLPHKNFCYSVEERIKRAKGRLGERKYNLATNNCEHFVMWCFDGEPRSYQAKRAYSVLGGLAALAVYGIYRYFDDDFI